MVKIDINYSALEDAMVRLLQYLSGKRAKSSEEYFCFTVCEEDRPLIGKLLRESLAWMSVRLARFWRSVEIAESRVVVDFDFGAPEDGASVLKEELEWLVKDILLYRMIYLWLRITGWKDLSGWEGKSENMAEGLERMVAMGANRKGLIVRRSFPFGNFL